MNLVLLQNSVLVSAGAAVLAAGFGFCGAAGLLVAGHRWRRWLLGAYVAVLALPSFLMVAAWMRYTQPGSWAAVLQPALYGVPGVIVLLALLLWPVAALSVEASWRQLPFALVEVEPMLRGWNLVRHLLIPAAWPTLKWSVLVIAALALGNFAVPAILQVKVLPVQMWVRFNTDLDVAGALLAAWPLVVMPVALLAWVLPRAPKAAAPAQVSADIPWGRCLGAPAAVVLCGVGGLVLVLSLGLPLMQLLSQRGTFRELPMALAAGQSAIFHSALFSGLAGALCVMAGMASWRWRWARAGWLFFFLPGVLIQMSMIELLNREAFAWLYPGSGVVLFALVLKYLAPAQALLAHGFRLSDHGLSETAMLSGASRWELFRHVYWPQNAHRIAAAWYISFLLCLWDVESLLLVVPPGVETVSLRVFNLLHYGHNAQVNSLCLVLLCLAVAPLVGWVLWQKGRWRSVTASVAGMLLLTGCAEDGFESALFSKAEVFGKRGAGLGEFNKPRSVAVDAAGNCFVADMTGRVQKFSPAGVFLLSWQMPQTDLGRPKGMGRDRAGNILVIEPHYSRVNVFAPEGRLLAQWGRHGTNSGELAFPRSIAANSRNELIVTEYGAVERVQIFTSTGERLLRCFGERGGGPGQFNRPEGVAVDASDRIYVADSCNHRIQVFSATGDFLRAFGKAGSALGQLSYPYDVAIGPDGQVYVCEFGNSRIQVFTPDGVPVEIIGGAGDAPGRFNNPWGLAFDGAGNLYVADALNHRVQRLAQKRGALAKGGP
jgi:ABC-type Fe3+ transport system permease subunit/sugar lactone lactonase YvrE